MCTICMLTPTFDPTRHPDVASVFDPDAPVVGTYDQQESGPATSAEMNSATSAAVGGSVNGTISTGGEQDFFFVNFEAGKTYVIDALGGPSGGGTLQETDLHLYDGNGNFIEYDDLDGTGFDAQITFTATTTGTYFIMVDGYSTTQTGSYTLTIAENTPPPPPTPATFQELATFLQSGFQGGQTYTFDTSTSNVITVNISGLTAAGQQLALWAMEAWEMVVNIDFQVVTSGEMLTVDDNQSGAFAYFPNTGNSNGVEINVGTGWLNTYGTSLDSYSFQTYIHEFGHALGLGHQGQYNGSATYGQDETFSNDSWQVSIMSYFSQTQNTTTNASYALLATTMMADILAIQGFYGAPGASSATAGNTTYGLGSNLGNYMDEIFAGLASGNTSTNYNGANMAFTIYDQGGIDTLNVSYLNASEAANINMNGGTFSDFGSLIGIMGIAVGTVVENAITGAGNDSILGNAAANAIIANDGNDAIQGNGGNDIINGGGGTDTAFFAANASNYGALRWGNITVVYDRVGGEGIDTLIDVELVSFTNGIVLSSALTAFDGLSYIASYGDLIAAYGANVIAGIQHFLISGLNEGRSITFDGLAYIASYGDLIGAFGTDGHAAAGHYITSGLNEGRMVTFSGLEYIASHADLIAAFGADANAGTLHFINSGFNEGRGTTFNGLEYIASYADLIGAFGTNADAGALHYIQAGLNEGRTVTFSSLNYIASYVDLILAFGTNVDAAAAHYIQFGLNEGRAATLRGPADAITNAVAGDAGNNTLNGTTGNDLIVGGGGNDTITGAAGSDVVAGGAGSDTFVFFGGGGTDVIADFSTADPNEKIQLSISSITDVADLFANHLISVNGEAVITYDGNAIILSGVTVAELDASDFIIT